MPLEQEGVRSPRTSDLPRDEEGKGRREREARERPDLRSPRGEKAGEPPAERDASRSRAKPKSPRLESLGAKLGVRLRGKNESIAAQLRFRKSERSAPAAIAVELP